MKDMDGDLEFIREIISDAEVVGPCEPIWKNDQDHTSIEGVDPQPKVQWDPFDENGDTGFIFIGTMDEFLTAIENENPGLPLGRLPDTGINGEEDLDSLDFTH